MFTKRQHSIMILRSKKRLEEFDKMGASESIRKREQAFLAELEREYKKRK